MHEAEVAEAVRESTRTDDRREFLRRAALGGAVAGGLWVAPSVLTLDRAVALGSVPCASVTTFNWISAFGGGSPSFPNGTGRTVTCATNAAFNVTMILTLTDTNNQIFSPGPYAQGGLTPGATYQVQNASNNGGFTSYFKARMRDGGSPATQVTHTMTFSRPIRNLTFTILDIDASLSGATFIDRVFAQGFNGATPVAFAVLGPGGPGVPGSNITGLGTAASPWTGVGPVADTSTSVAGNVELCFVQPVTVVNVVHLRSLNPPGYVSGQHISISNLTWCNDCPP